jgi:alpha-tubulin suppressor-like RCC1 family protein
VKVGSLSNVRAIAAGARHCLALKTDGTVWAWGYNSAGQIGDGTKTIRPSPVRVATGVIAIAAGEIHSLALKSTTNVVLAWGSNTYGQLGTGVIGGFSTTPVQVSGLSGVSAIAAGHFHSLTIKSSLVRAWGANSFGQLGNNTTTHAATAVTVNGLSGVTAISGGNSHSLALKTDGSVWAWGANGSGQMGDGTRINRLTPVRVSGLSSGVIAIAAGLHHSLALKSSNTVQTWGANGSGQLGSGAVGGFRTTPMTVSGLSSVSGIGAGWYHSLAIAP